MKVGLASAVWPRHCSQGAHNVKDRIYKMVKAHTKPGMADYVLLVVVLISGGLWVASANTPAPDIPLYPGSHYIDLPWTWGGPKPDLLIVMEVSEPNMDVYESYSELLAQHGWGGTRTCYSGLPGSQSWHHDSTWLLDFQGWSMEADYRYVSGEDKTDIVISAWRGSISVVPCGDL
jgi:hypothetical protein